MGMALDVIGLLLIFVGLSLNWLGHHYFGPLIFWGGAVFDAAGLYLIGRTVQRQRDIEKSLTEYQGPGDFGDTHYHGGSHHHSEHSGSNHDAGPD